MFHYDLEEDLRKKLKILSKKDKVLAKIFKKKVSEIINHDEKSINTYKNLKSPLNEFKRIHLTNNYILLFKVNIEKNHILFLDIVHRDKAYKNF